MKSLESENLSVPFHRSLDVAHAESYVINSFELHHLSDLNLWRHFWIHQGSPAVRVDYLSSDPARLFRTEECNNIADICRCPQASHRRPTAAVPVPNQLLDLVGQCVHHTVLGPSRA